MRNINENNKNNGFYRLPALPLLRQLDPSSIASLRKSLLEMAEQLKQFQEAGVELEGGLSSFFKFMDLDDRLCREPDTHFIIDDLEVAKKFDFYYTEDCPYCRVEEGELHEKDCMLEYCPSCRQVALGCECDGPHASEVPDEARIPWHANAEDVRELQEFFACDDDDDGDAMTSRLPSSYEREQE